MTESPSEIIPRLRDIVGDDGLLFNREELLVDECDGYTVEKKELMREQLANLIALLKATWKDVAASPLHRSETELAWES